MRKKNKHAKSIDHRCDIQSTYVTVPTSSNTIQTVFLHNFYSFLPSAVVSVYLQTTASPEKELLQVYVRTRAVACPILQCFVRLCKIMSTNCQSSCISKHSYMHNHASYMFTHLIKLSCHSYMFALSIPMIISIKISLVNFKISSANNKCLLSCQFQSSTVLSTFLSKFKLLQLCQSNSSLFQIQFVSVIGQAASSCPRTACAYQFVSVIGQVASSHPRTACTYPFDILRATSSDPRTARAFYFVSCQPSN